MLGEKKCMWQLWAFCGTFCVASDSHTIKKTNENIYRNANTNTDKRKD